MSLFFRLIQMLCVTGFLVVAVCGCSSGRTFLPWTQRPPQEQSVMLDPPKIETEQDVNQDPTLLEKYKAATKTAEEQMVRVSKLATELAAEKAALHTAQAEVGALKDKNELLKKRTAAFDKLVKDYDESQHQQLSLTGVLRNLRQELLKEKLTRVKLEQTILALRIDVAKAKRRELLNKSEYKQSADAKEGKQ